MRQALVLALSVLVWAAAAIIIAPVQAVPGAASPVAGDVQPASGPVPKAPPDVYMVGCGNTTIGGFPSVSSESWSDLDCNFKENYTSPGLPYPVPLEDSYVLVVVGVFQTDGPLASAPGVTDNYGDAYTLGPSNVSCLAVYCVSVYTYYAVPHGPYPNVTALLRDSASYPLSLEVFAVANTSGIGATGSNEATGTTQNLTVALYASEANETGVGFAAIGIPDNGQYEAYDLPSNVYCSEFGVDTQRWGCTNEYFTTASAIGPTGGEGPPVGYGIPDLTGCANGCLWSSFGYAAGAGNQTTGAGYVYPTIYPYTIDQPTPAYSFNYSMAGYAFLPILQYSLAFHESGLPSGYYWQVNVSGVAHTVHTSTLTLFPILDGVYDWTTNASGPYTPIPGSGVAVIESNDVTVDLQFYGTNGQRAPAISASFTWRASELTVTFADTSIATGGAAIQDSGITWYFGDGSSGTGADPVHAYSSAGTYLVNESVPDQYGTTWNASAYVNVSASCTPTSCSGGSLLPPSDLHILSEGVHEVTLAWDLPSEYLVNTTIYWAADEDSCAFNNAESLDGVAFNGTVTGLTEDEPYCFAVTVWNSTLQSGYSNFLWVVIDAPYNLGVVDQGETWVLLDWANPPLFADSNNTVYVGLAPYEWTEALSTGGPETAWNVTGLNESTLYYFSVQSWNDTVPSFFAAPISDTTDGPAGGSPSGGGGGGGGGTSPPPPVPGVTTNKTPTGQTCYSIPIVGCDWILIVAAALIGIGLWLLLRRQPQWLGLVPLFAGALLGVLFGVPA